MQGLFFSSEKCFPPSLSVILQPSSVTLQPSSDCAPKLMSRPLDGPSFVFQCKTVLHRSGGDRPLTAHHKPKQQDSVAGTSTHTVQWRCSSCGWRLLRTPSDCRQQPPDPLGQWQPQRSQQNCHAVVGPTRRQQSCCPRGRRSGVCVGGGGVQVATYEHCEPLLTAPSVTCPQRSPGPAADGGGLDGRGCG